MHVEILDALIAEQSPDQQLEFAASAENVLRRTRADRHGCVLRTRRGGEVRRWRGMRLQFAPGARVSRAEEDRMLRVM